MREEFKKLVIEKPRGVLNNKNAYKHGLSNSFEYRAYSLAKHRCNNKLDKSFKNYGGRGIKFIFTSFKDFFKEIGERPSSEYTLDRIDNNGNYEQGNIRWATRGEQGLNKRNNVMVTFNGKQKPLSYWAINLKVNYHVLYKILTRKGIDKLNDFMKKKTGRNVSIQIKQSSVSKQSVTF